MSNFYPPNVLPRIELKFKAKELLRGNWPVLIGVTLLYLLLTGFQMNYTYDVTDGGPLVEDVADANTAQIVASYFHSSLSALGSAIASIGVGKVILTAILAIVSALLIKGVLTYCYTAWFIKLAEIGNSRPLTFADFTEGFTNGVKAMLAYVWQQIWLNIWSLIGLPGFLLMVFTAFQSSSHDTAYYSGIATGSMGFGLFFGTVLYLAGMIVVLIITVRYGFIFQLIADGRGKVGARQSLRYSCAITKGHLKELIVLEISFIPWYILSAFTFGFGFFYTFPYIEATRALTYRWLRDQAFQDGRLDPAALGYVKAGGAQQQAAADGPVIDI